MQGSPAQFPPMFAGMSQVAIWNRAIALIALVLCGTICGANTWADIERFARAHIDWFRRFLDLPFGVPSHDTPGRVFARLDTETFQECPGRWVKHLQLRLERNDRLALE